MTVQRDEDTAASTACNGERIRYKELLKEKRALQLILCGIFVMGTNVANNTYFSFLFTEGDFQGPMFLRFYPLQKLQLRTQQRHIAECMVNGILLTEYVKYPSETVSFRLIALTVAAFYAVSSNGGTILCNFFGGVAMDFFLRFYKKSSIFS